MDKYGKSEPQKRSW